MCKRAIQSGKFTYKVPFLSLCCENLPSIFDHASHDPYDDILFFRNKRHVLYSILFIAFNFYLGYYYTATYTLLNRDMCLLYQDKQIIQQPMELKNMTQRLTVDAISFITQSAKEKKPFFLFMSYLKVHTALFNNVEFIEKGRTQENMGITLLSWIGVLVKFFKV